VVISIVAMTYWEMFFPNTPRKILAASLIMCMFVFTSKLLANIEYPTGSRFSVSFDDIVIVTRIHGKSANSLPQPEVVLAKVSAFLAYSRRVLICIDIGESNQNEVYIKAIQERLNHSNISSQVQIVTISPWGRFVSALNSAVIVAKDLHFKFICFQSLELSISLTAVQFILSLIDSKTLVIGNTSIYEILYNTIVTGFDGTTNNICRTCFAWSRLQ
jgi:hypothetical protein